MNIQPSGPRLQAAISAASIQSSPRDARRRTGEAPAIDQATDRYTSRSRSDSRM